jgi:hypothetical protein
MSSREKLLRFTATTVDFASSAKDVKSALLANPEEERVVWFQRQGDGRSYVERDDQSFSTYGGVVQVALSKGRLTVALDATGKRKLKCDAIDVALELDAKQLKQLRTSLAAIFEDRLSVDASFAKTAPAPAKPKKKAKPKQAAAKPMATTAIKELVLSEHDLATVRANIATMPLESLYFGSAPADDVADLLRKVAPIPTLAYVQLSSKCVPPEIGFLESLKELRVVRSGPEPLAFPEEFWRLAGLLRLDLGGNVVPRLPDAVRGLAALEEISLFDCGLESLPEAIGELPNLKVLNVSSNPKLGKLPKSVTRNKSLTIYK